MRRSFSEVRLLTVRMCERISAHVFGGPAIPSKLSNGERPSRSAERSLTCRGVMGEALGSLLVTGVRAR